MVCRSLIHIHSSKNTIWKWFQLWSESMCFVFYRSMSQKRWISQRWRFQFSSWKFVIYCLKLEMLSILRNDIWQSIKTDSHTCMHSYTCSSSGWTYNTYHGSHGVPPTTFSCSLVMKSFRHMVTEINIYADQFWNSPESIWEHVALDKYKSWAWLFLPCVSLFHTWPFTASHPENSREWGQRPGY